jgi:hypothetical protein
MKLLIIWASISIAIGFLKFNNIQYILLSLVMLFITYYSYNKLNPPITMSIRNGILLSIIPNTFIYYLAYHCNNFLWVHPYEWGTFGTVFLIYSYILMYIAWEC